MTLEQTNTSIGCFRLCACISNPHALVLPSFHHVEHGHQQAMHSTIYQASSFDRAACNIVEIDVVDLAHPLRFKHPSLLCTRLEAGCFVHGLQTHCASYQGGLCNVLRRAVPVQARTSQVGIVLFSGIGGLVLQLVILVALCHRADDESPRP